jgi:hypothetical protein
MRQTVSRFHIVKQRALAAVLMLAEVGAWLVSDFGVYGVRLQTWVPVAVFVLSAGGVWGLFVQRHDRM